MRSLIEHERTDVVLEAIASLEVAAANVELVRSLTYSKDVRVRQASVAFMIGALTASELVSFVDDYMTGGGYFYNVVVWIDRMLYSKGDLRRQFQEQLHASSQ